MRRRENSYPPPRAARNSIDRCSPNDEREEARVDRSGICRCGREGEGGGGSAETAISNEPKGGANDEFAAITYRRTFGPRVLFEAQRAVKKGPKRHVKYRYTENKI